jgi:hypothetical protein
MFAMSVDLVSLHHMSSRFGRRTRPTATSEEPVFQPTRENLLENQYSGRLYQVHVLCSTGVGSRSLFDHFSSPIGVWPSFTRGARRKSTKASFDWKGAVICRLVGISSLPMVVYLLSDGLFVKTVLPASSCLWITPSHMSIDQPYSGSRQFTQVVSTTSQSPCGRLYRRIFSRRNMLLPAHYLHPSLQDEIKNRGQDRNTVSAPGSVVDTTSALLD